MAKTKRTVRKIIWDTAHGIGTARSIAPSVFSIKKEETIVETISRSLKKEQQFLMTQDVGENDPYTLSPHLLDLRHTVSQSTFSPSRASFTSRLFSRFFSFRNAKSAIQKEPLTPFAHFPAIHAASLEAIFVEPPKTPLYERFPLFAELSIGVPVVAFLRLGDFFGISFDIVFRFMRICKSMVRYWWRTWRLEIVTLKERAGTIAIPVHLEPIPLRSPSRRIQYRVLVVFIAMALLTTLPIHALSSYASFNAGAIEERGEDIARKLPLAIAALGEGKWDVAREQFLTIEKESSSFGNDIFVTRPIIGSIGSILSSRFRTGRAVVESIRAASAAGIAITTIGETLSRDTLLTERLIRIEAPLSDTESALLRITESLRSIEPGYLPKQFQEKIQVLTPLLSDATAFVTRVRGLFGFAPSILGHDRPMRYLVLFQNDAEARATGGFIGSIAVADIDGGAVRKIFIPTGGSYDLQGSLRVNERSPGPLQYINPRFEFQDANWWPDFPTSAKKLLFFWEKSGGPTVDGVIAVNASFLQELLRITGPVDMPAYGKRIDADNFFLETQKAVELEYDRVANTPKKFLRDLADALIARFAYRSQKDLLPLGIAFMDALATKDIQLFMHDPELQKQLIGEHVAGAFQSVGANDDVLRIVRTNIAGGKTDHAVRDSIAHETTIADDGAMRDRVTITRVHTGTRGALFLGARHRDYLRLYVPEGATLLHADGFSLPTRTREMPLEEYRDDPDIASFYRVADGRSREVIVGQEQGRTVFGGWVELDPGEVKTIVLEYVLPFAVSDTRFPHYQLLLEKQPGQRTTTIQHRTILPAYLAMRATSLPALGNPLPWKYDMTLLETFAR